MNFDPKITEQLKAFVNAEEKKRNYEDAAMLLLQVSGNRVEYRNNIANLQAKKQHILNRLRQYLDFRLKALTKQEVAEMSAQAEKIVEKIPETEEKIKYGKREDHDSLPDEIIAAYKETQEILQKQRQLHLKIRSLALADAPCPDSDLFPFVKEIIELDKKRLADWKMYDDYKPAKSAEK